MLSPDHRGKGKILIWGKSPGSRPRRCSTICPASVRIGSETEDYGVKNVDVASHRSKRGFAFNQNGGRRGRFSADCAIVSIAGVLLGCRYHHRHHAINSWRSLDRLEARFAGTALGAAMAALLMAYAAQNVAAFGAGVFVLGLICAPLCIGRNAFRHAGITLTIVMLVARAEPAWIIAIYRFLEISVGIAIGLLLTAVWPEPEPAAEA
jgi:fusaric acid resistance family protein